MTKDEIIEMLKKSGLDESRIDMMMEFAELIKDIEREVIANWIMGKGFATGHGDNIVDMLDELEWQVAEREREECAKRLDAVGHRHCAANIRARGKE